MIKEFKILTGEEKMLLLKAPVIVTVLTLSSFKEINKAKDDAVKLVHMKTFTEHYLLIPYYEEVDKTFKKDLEEYAAKFIPFETMHCAAIKKDMENVNAVIDKLEIVYGGLLRKSLAGFARHINQAARNIFQDLIFPVAFSKL